MSIWGNPFGGSESEGGGSEVTFEVDSQVLLQDGDADVGVSGKVVSSDHVHPADVTIIKQADVVDTLDSESTTAPLSANQGRVLELGKSDTGHDHDEDYAADDHNHDEDYSAIAHDHDLTYSAIAHDHDEDYAADDHNHDEDYSAIAHDHDEDYSADDHVHGSITNDGKVGVDANIPLITGVDGVVGAGAFGTSANEFAADDHNHDLTYSAIAHDHDEDYAADDHVHGSITNDGKVGVDANIPLITGVDGVVGAGAFGTSANEFAEGDHDHDSDYEAALGNPSVDDRVLSSKADGTRSWVVLSAGGDVSGPAESVSGNIVTFSGTGGKTIQDSGSALSDLATDDHDHDTAYEAALGNPLVDDRVLSSKADGTRSWVVLSAGGDVSGPAESVSNNFSSFDGTGGKTLKDSGVGADSFATAAHDHDSDYAADDHVHGTITNDGKVGVDANIPLITGVDGVVGAGAFGTSANEFAEGDHDHDSDYAADDHNHDEAYSAIAHDHDLTYSAIAHDHDEDYAADDHNHDEAYSAIAHDHDLTYSAIAHDHDEDYSADDHVHGSITNDGKVGVDANIPLITGVDGVVGAGAFGTSANEFAEGDHDHDSDYAADDHNHDLTYSAIAHDHDEDYAADDHNHDLTYSAIAHDHDEDYAVDDHNHDLAYSAIAHDHDEDYSAIAHDHDSDYAADDHVHGNITNDGKIGSTANLPIMTGTAGAVTVGSFGGSANQPAEGDKVALLAGRSGGQTLIGGTASGNSLTLQSSSHATKGKILFGNSAYDEVNNRLGIGTTTPDFTLTLGSTITFGVGNAVVFKAKNSGGDYETWCHPRWSDDKTYINFGSNGFIIRNNSTTTVMSMSNGGNVGIGMTNPTARLHLPAGTASASTAPLKLTTGTLLTTPEAGAIEYLQSGTEGRLYASYKINDAVTRVELASTRPNIILVTGNGSLTEAQCLDTIVVNTGMSSAGESTFPALSYRTRVTLLVEAAGKDWELVPPSGEKFVLSGTELDADQHVIVGDVLGDGCVLMRMYNGAAYQWWIYVSKGTFTEET